MNPTIITVALFGIANIGALIFGLGDLKARVKNLELWKEKAGSEIADTASQVAFVKGHLGL